MFYQNGLCIKCKISFIAFFKRKFAGKSNQISRNSGVNLIFPFVEFCTFNQVHIKMVATIAQTDKTLNDFLIVFYNKFVGRSVTECNLLLLIEQPICFFNLTDVLSKHLNHLGIKNID